MTTGVLTTPHVPRGSSLTEANEPADHSRVETIAPSAPPELVLAAAPSVPTDPQERGLRLRRMVDSYIDLVARVLRNAGTPEAEVDDYVQRAFITVERRLDDVRVGAEKSFLIQVALNLAAHARRSLARRREVPAEEALDIADASATPEQLVDRSRARRMLDRVLDQMDPDLRTVFVLYEFEELNMAQIASALEIPRGTVASRLRRARAAFRDRAQVIERLSIARNEVRP